MNVKFWVRFGMGSLLWAAVAVAVTPDNSAVNERDSSVVEQTAGQQGSKTSDVEMTRQIRKAVMSHDELSRYAQNVKIITNNGQVTLKGPVRNETEILTIEKIARHLAGRGNVVNEMQVASGE